MHRSCVAEVNGTVAGTAVGSSSLTPRPDLLTSLWLRAAITWGWPQHMFVYPGVKWVYGDFAGSALDCPALKFRSPQSSHQGKEDGWDRLPDFVQRQPTTLAMNPFAPMTWATSLDSTLFLTNPLHFLRVFLPSEGVLWCRQGSLAPRFGSLGLWAPGLQWFPPVPCCKGERRGCYPKQRLWREQGLSRVLCSV